MAAVTNAPYTGLPVPLVLVSA